MTSKLGAFEILYALKSGGMGDVLLARRRGPGGFEQLVAVKTIRPDLLASETARTMFLDEARLLARLTHPAIAIVHDFGEDGALFLAMEYVQGIRFRELIQRRPPPLVAARAIADACRGLHAAHELRDLGGAPMGVVHRDISPENLMLGFDGQVKVLDFGIALTKGRMTVTEHGTVKGKPPYMSPEQARGLALDRRSDVFSIALVLHELLTGEPVFTGESIYAVARAVVEAPIEPPASAVAGLDEVVMAALVRDRDARTPTAAALADALDRVTAGAESLPAWTEHALASDRDHHRKWLADLISDGTTTNRKIGRHSGMVTARAPEIAETPKPPSVELPPPATEPSLTVPPSRRGAVIGVAVALAFLAVLAVILASRCGREEERVAVGADARAVRPDATAPPPSPIDAAPIADAAPTLPIDASRPPRDGGRPPPPPIDARTPPPIDAAPAATPIDAATPAGKPGFITILADPFALIRIDGEELGTTPIYKRKLAPGPHEVELRSPDGGVVRLKKTVQITSGQLERIDIP